MTLDGTFSNIVVSPAAIDAVAGTPKIFDTKDGYVNQRNAFMHEYMLDIKALIRAKEEKESQEKYGIRIPPAKKIVKTKE